MSGVHESDDHPPKCSKEQPRESIVDAFTGATVTAKAIVNPKVLPRCNSHREIPSRQESGYSYESSCISYNAPGKMVF